MKTTTMRPASKAPRAAQSGKDAVNPLEHQYPAVKFAYEIGIKSYDWAFRRAEVADERIEKLLTWATGFNLALVALAANLSARLGVMGFHSMWFYGATILFVVGMLIGTIAKLKGSLTIVSPSLLYRGHLHLSEWEFKKDMLWRSSEAFEHNLRLVNSKGRIATIASIAFLFEAVALSGWFISLG